MHLYAPNNHGNSVTIKMLSELHCCSTIAKYFIIHLISERHVFFLVKYERQKSLLLLFVSCRAIVNYFTPWEYNIHPQFLKSVLVSSA